jgi:hypothetical protein
MKPDVEFDPLTGITTTLDYDSDPGKVIVKQYQDLSEFTKYAAERRAREKPVQSETWNHYAIIPAIVMHEMFKRGIDVSRDGPAVFKFINEHYPALKLTTRWHDDRRAKVKDTKIIVK